jgi:Proteasome subunit
LTIVVGVRCTDGIVIGADSAATSSAGVVPIMRQDADDKIDIFDKTVIVATTGSVGFKQRLSAHVDRALKGNVFTNLVLHEACANISTRFLTDVNSSLAARHPQNGLGFGALVAAVIKGQPQLIEYATDNFQHQVRDGNSFFVSMGSGQNLADPFLAFVARVLWKNTLPDVQLGRFGLFWALRHTITLAPGLVGPPIRLATLAKVDGKWIASTESDTQAAEQYVAALEDRIGHKFSEVVEEAKVETPPPPPKADG